MIQKYSVEVWENVFLNSLPKGLIFRKSSFLTMCSGIVKLFGDNTVDMRLEVLPETSEQLIDEWLAYYDQTQFIQTSWDLQKKKDFMSLYFVLKNTDTLNNSKIQSIADFYGITAEVVKTSNPHFSHPLYPTTGEDGQTVITGIVTSIGDEMVGDSVVENVEYKVPLTIRHNTNSEIELFKSDILSHKLAIQEIQFIET